MRGYPASDGLGRGSLADGLGSKTGSLSSHNSIYPLGVAKSTVLRLGGVKLNVRCEMHFRYEQDNPRVGL